MDCELRLIKINAFRVVFLVSLLFPSLLLAQNNTDFLVLNSNDTLFGKVEYLNENGFGTSFYNKIRIKPDGKRRKKVARKKVLSFRVQDIVYEGFWLNQEAPSFPKITIINPRYDIDPENGEYYFLRLIHKDKLSHYELEWIDEDNDTVWSLALFKKEMDTFFIRADQGIFGLKRKVLAEYFSDCMELVEAIENKELKQVHEVVEYYNSRCVN